MVESFLFASFEELKIKGMQLEITKDELVAWPVLAVCAVNYLSATGE